MTQALTMDDFEFQIIMDEEEGRELEDEEYLQQQQVALGVLCFAGAEEAHQCQAECRQSHRTYLTCPDLKTMCSALQSSQLGCWNQSDTKCIHAYMAG